MCSMGLFFPMRRWHLESVSTTELVKYTKGIILTLFFSVLFCPFHFYYESEQHPPNKSALFFLFLTQVGTQCSQSEVLIHKFHHLFSLFKSFNGFSHSKDNGDTLVGHEICFYLALAYSSKLSFTTHSSFHLHQQ